MPYINNINSNAFNCLKHNLGNTDNNTRLYNNTACITRRVVQILYFSRDNYQGYRLLLVFPYVLYIILNKLLFANYFFEMPTSVLLFRPQLYLRVCLWQVTTSTLFAGAICSSVPVRFAPPSLSLPPYQKTANMPRKAIIFFEVCTRRSVINWFITKVDCQGFLGFALVLDRFGDVQVVIWPTN